MNEGIVYKESTTVFGKVVCTHCGRTEDLMHVEMSAIHSSRPYNSFETIICKDCFNDLPSLKNSTKNEATEKES